MISQDLEEKETQNQESIQLNQSFPLISYEQIKLSLEDTSLCQKQNEKLNTLIHEPHYEWIGQQLPVFNSKDPQQIRLFMITWNMHGLLIGSQLRKLLRSDELQHHLVVFGTQECQRSIGFSMFCDSKEEWENQIFNELGKNYAMVASHKLNALHLCVFAHASIVQLINEKQVGHISTGRFNYHSQGFLNVVGNKGAVAISFTLGTKKFLFLNNHLASGQNVQEERNREFHRIKSEFPLGCNSSLVSVEKKFDYTFWIGDFNSRIDNINLSVTNIGQQTFFDLLLKDQFLNSRYRHDMYEEFKEGMILFPPSYKLQHSEAKFTSKKEWRVPGWTDRILFHEHINTYMSSPPLLQKGKSNQIIPVNELEQEETCQFENKQSNINLVNYDSATNVWGSDHRPVFAQFIINI